jgi:phosphoglycerate dehydrogenase-like enzyme
MGWGVTNKIVGPVGLGGVAKEFFKLSKPFFMHKCAVDPGDVSSHK